MSMAIQNLKANEKNSRLVIAHSARFRSRKNRCQSAGVFSGRSFIAKHPTITLAIPATVFAG